MLSPDDTVTSANVYTITCIKERNSVSGIGFSICILSFLDKNYYKNAIINIKNNIKIKTLPTYYLVFLLSLGEPP